MSARSIKAGQAFVEIIAKLGPLKQTLAQGTKDLRRWGSSLSSVGAMATKMAVGFGVAAIGTAVAGAQTMAREFAAAGAELTDMSERTGVAASALQFFGFAARQSGADLRDIEDALRRMVRSGFAVTEFETLGKEIAGIADPTERARRALEVFGRGGTKLIPMFQNLNALMEQNKALGPTLTAEDIKRADELSDALDALTEAFKRLREMAGSVVAPALMPIVAALTGAAVELNKAIANQDSAFNESALSGEGWSNFARRIAASGAAAITAPPKRMDIGTDRFSDMDAEAKADKDRIFALELQRKIYAAIVAKEKERLSLIREYETDAERFLRKEQEIFKAITQLNNQRLLGEINPANAAAQKAALETALARLRAAEMERRLRLMPEPERIEREVTSLRGAARGTFSAAAAGLLGRSGASNLEREAKIHTTELRGIRRAVEKFTPATFG